MDLKTIYTVFAGYNCWANRRLYDASANLTDDQYRADRGAFFGSVHATLNHILVADQIWMRRFTGDGPTWSELDHVPFADLLSLRKARDAEDQRITSYVDSLDVRDLTGLFSYRTISNPKEISQPLATALSHFFNHQAHHRGQVHTLLTSLAGRRAAPEMDLIYFQRESGLGMA